MDEIFTYKGVGWVKEANKLGIYKSTYNKFRIYTIKEPTSIKSIVKREGVDGLWRRTDFTQGEYVAIDKYGVTYKGKYWDIISKIDIDVMMQLYGK